MTTSHTLKKDGTIDGRTFNGGKRPGAGRPFTKERQLAESYALQKVLVKEQRNGQIRTVRKERLLVVMDQLFKIAMTGSGNQRIRAISLYLDYAIGKPERSDCGEGRSKRESRRTAVVDPKVREILEEVFRDESIKPLK